MDYKFMVDINEGQFDNWRLPYVGDSLGLFLGPLVNVDQSFLTIFYILRNFSRARIKVCLHSRGYVRFCKSCC